MAETASSTPGAPIVEITALRKRYGTNEGRIRLKQSSHLGRVTRLRGVVNFIGDGLREIAAACLQPAGIR
mgnify:CR=1 FL=1